MHPEPNASAPTAARGRVCVLAAAVLWSLSGVITKRLELDSLTIAFYRGLFAGLVLLPFVPRSRWRFRPAMIPLAVTFGIMGGLYLGAVKGTTAANAICLQYTAVFWTIPLSLWLLGERPDPRAILGVALASIGIGAIVLFGYDGRPNEGQGIALGLASGLAYAGVAVGLRAVRDLDPIWLSAVNNLAGSVILGLWIVIVRGSIALPEPLGALGLVTRSAAPIADVISVSQLLALIGFGAVQMAIPYVLFARGLRAISAPEANLLALAEPVLNPIWVILFLHEWPTVTTAVGGALLLAGVLCRYLPIGSRKRTIEPVVPREHSARAENPLA